MTTKSYTDNSIFTNPRANALCDLLFTKLLDQFPATIPDPTNDYVFKGIVLSGVGADVLQGATIKELNNITFETDKTDVFIWLQANLGKIYNCKVINYKERTLFYPFDDFYFEIWFLDTALNPLSEYGIFVQKNTDINPETL